MRWVSIPWPMNSPQNQGHWGNRVASGVISWRCGCRTFQGLHTFICSRHGLRPRKISPYTLQFFNFFCFIRPKINDIEIHDPSDRLTIDSQNPNSPCDQVKIARVSSIPAFPLEKTHFLHLSRSRLEEQRIIATNSSLNCRKRGVFLRCYYLISLEVLVSQCSSYSFGADDTLVFAVTASFSLLLIPLMCFEALAHSRKLTMRVLWMQSIFAWVTRLVDCRS